jgi:signal transduction histidine kinase
MNRRKRSEKLKKNLTLRPRINKLSQDLHAHQMQPGTEKASTTGINQEKQMEEALRKSEMRFQLSSQLLTAHDTERKKLAEELDQSILSKLSAIKNVLEKKINQLGKEFASERLELENLLAAVRHAAEDSRKLIINLYPTILDTFGLVGGINFFLNEYQKIYSHVQLTREIFLQDIDVPKNFGLAIFRVLQEALNNFIEHSQGDQVYVGLRKKGGDIRLLVDDNGAGFHPESCQSGLGRESMKSRVELSGGIFKIESTPGKGTTIRASWPLNEG